MSTFEDLKHRWVVYKSGRAERRQIFALMDLLNSEKFTGDMKSLRILMSLRRLIDEYFAGMREMLNVYEETHGKGKAFIEKMRRDLDEIEK